MILFRSKLFSEHSSVNCSAEVRVGLQRLAAHMVGERGRYVKKVKNIEGTVCLKFIFIGEEFERERHWMRQEQLLSPE